MKKNLVLGAVRGYGFEQLRPFVVSLKRTMFDGDLVLLWNSLGPETLQAARDHGVKLAHFSYRGSGALNSWSRFWPGLAPFVRLTRGSAIAHGILKAILPLQTGRFLHYRDFLQAHAHEYQNVLITDIRDVLFQADPFSKFDKGLLAFEEAGDVPIGQEAVYNAAWIKSLFGAEVLAQVERFPVLCSGTVMGDVPSMLQYLGSFEKLLCRARDVGMGGADQGVHNYLCRVLISSTAQVSKNGAGPVLTMVPFLKEGADFGISDTGQVLNPAGQLVPVLHQYDRHPNLAASLIERLFAAVRDQKGRLAT